MSSASIDSAHWPNTAQVTESIQPALEATHAIAQSIYADGWNPLQDRFNQQLALLTDHAFLEEGELYPCRVPEVASLIGFTHPRFVLDNEPYISFGFWESHNDPKANQALFSQLFEWARQRGIKRVIGPIDRSTAYRYRLKLNAFDQRPFYSEPYNPAYYPHLLEQVGFTLRHRYYSWLDDLSPMADRFRDYVAPMRAALETNSGITFRPLGEVEPALWKDEFYPLAQKTFQHNIAYSGFSKTLIETLYGDTYFNALCPHASVIALTHTDRIAGFFLAIPDYHQFTAGAPFEQRLSAPNYRQDFPLLATKTLLGKTAGVAPLFRRTHLFTVMSQLVAEWGTPLYQKTGAVMVHEQNPSARIASLAFGDTNQMEYGLYEHSTD